MVDLVHNFSARKRKWGASFKQVTDVTPEVVGEADQHLTSRGSEELVIVIMDSPVMGFHGKSALKTAPSTDLGEIPLTHEKVQKGTPDRLLLYSYIPPHGQAPLMEEVSALGPEGAQEIVNRWDPFNRGESPAAHLEQLYLAMPWMPTEVRAEGKGKKYVVSIPTYTRKEDLKQVVEDDILIHNRNFVQSAEIVCSQLLCTALVSLPSHCFIIRCSFASCYDYSEHDLPASRFSDLTEGCGEVAALCPIGRF